MTYRVSAKALALLQLCRNGKCEIYGDELYDEWFNDEDDIEIKDEEGPRVGELLAYRSIAAQYEARTALERWRLRPDEVDAEIAFDNHKLLKPRLSIAELQALWYDCIALKARRLFYEVVTPRYPYASSAELDGLKIDKSLQDLYLMTLDIPTETGKPFPFEKVFLGWPGGSDAGTFRAHINTGLCILVASFREGSHPDIKALGGNPDNLYRHMRDHISHRANQWGMTLEDIRTSNEELMEIAHKHNTAS